jgi:hypothetical protein
MPDSAQETKGRRVAVIVAWLLIVSEVAVDLFYLLSMGPGKILQNSVSLLLLVLLVRALLAKRQWARWTIAGLLMLGIVIGAPIAVAEWMNGQHALAASVTALLASDFTVVLLLLCSQPLAAYVKSGASQGAAASD